MELISIGTKWEGRKSTQIDKWSSACQVMAQMMILDYL